MAAHHVQAIGHWFATLRVMKPVSRLSPTLAVQPNTPRRRLLLGAMALPALQMLNGCGAQRIADYAGERPLLDLRAFFNGGVEAYGVFTDRSGKVVKRFTVAMQCGWSGPPGQEQGVLDEQFLYSDGTRQRRVWRLLRTPGSGGQGRYTGVADDVVGQAAGEEQGNAFYWTYTLKLPVDASVYEVRFDDWMYMMSPSVVINKASMSKLGVFLGEVTLTFVKR